MRTELARVIIENLPPTTKTGDKFTVVGTFTAGVVVNEEGCATLFVGDMNLDLQKIT